jgi:flavin-binding protein dodecin
VNSGSKVVKVIELIGSSPESWKEAVKNAVEEASKTLENIVGVDVQGCSGVIKNGKIVEYRANVKIAFVVEKKR